MRQSWLTWPKTIDCLVLSCHHIHKNIVLLHTSQVYIYLTCMIITQVAYCHIDRYDYLSHTAVRTNKRQQQRATQHHTMESSSSFCYLNPVVHTHFDEEHYSSITLLVCEHLLKIQFKLYSKIFHKKNRSIEMGQFMFVRVCVCEWQKINTQFILSQWKKFTTN